ncbi:uncharacterized protein LOC133178094 [Saccostrea echinata]|uniref:uncharacterized protein LOC133178094 n=1 Tax=Saccostrea echinata TaxID=191078 RepID=UPI002A7F83AE|nr:uncharacterized protein LOC133178094 [Saccostrea echinata]
MGLQWTVTYTFGAYTWATNAGLVNLQIPMPSLMDLWYTTLLKSRCFRPNSERLSFKFPISQLILRPLLKQEEIDIISYRNSLYKNGCIYGSFVTTVFLLDTSASMTGEGLQQMKRAFRDIISEFSKHSSAIPENVSIVTFGEEVKVLHYYSTDYTTIAQCVDNIHCGGSSPLEAGIIMCLSGIGSAPYIAIGSYHVRTRIVIITDGKPTEICTGNDQEIYESRVLDETSDRIIDLVRKIGATNPIFCIPVGADPDICFLGTMIMQSKGGKIIPHQEAGQFGKYTVNTELASKVLQRMPVENLTSRAAIKAEVCYMQSVSEKDLDDVCEIIENREAYKSGRELREEAEIENEMEYQERYAHMPCVGTRVRRAPDWSWKNQDGHGAGTVVGHSKRVGWINVEWDTGLQLSYRYGDNGVLTEYDIVPCDEPRILENQAIAVGCLVMRGRDWKWDEQDGGEGNIGTVYRLKSPTEIYVRWSNGNKSNYRYGYNGKFDVELCDPFDPNIREILKRQEEKQREPRAYSNTESNRKKSSITPKTTSVTNKTNTPYYKNSRDRSSSRRWQWRADKWTDFPDEENETIQQFYTQTTGRTFLITLNGQLYRINLQKKWMVNTSTKEVIDIRLL